MKRVAFTAFTLLMIYSIYHDLTVGTYSPRNRVISPQLVSAEEAPLLGQLPYIEVEIKPGDTILSIIERNTKTPVQVPIDQVVADFKRLNQNAKPEHIQVGRQYKIPLYSNL